MAYNFKETMNKPERLAPGHRMCAGCGGTIAVRNVLRGLHEGDKAVIGNATGCLEVSTYMYPYTAWEDSYIHNAFENAGATLSGVETAYKALKKNGFTGTGLAQPKPAISIINAPIGSKCANGFSVSRPAAFAVLSPRQYAT